MRNTKGFEYVCEACCKSLNIHYYPNAVNAVGRKACDACGDSEPGHFSIVPEGSIEDAKANPVAAVDNVFPMKHVIQTLDNNCVSACLSMVLNKPIDTVTAEFHEKYLAGVLDEHEYLDLSGIPYRKHLSCERGLDDGYVYMVIVPSLNIRAGSHLICIMVDEDGMWALYDPNEGREGKLFYGNSPSGDLPTNCVQIQAWVQQFSFKLSDVAERYTL